MIIRRDPNETQEQKDIRLEINQTYFISFSIAYIFLILTLRTFGLESNLLASGIAGFAMGYGLSKVLRYKLGTLRDRYYGKD